MNGLPTLRETDIQPEKMDGWKMILLLGRPIFNCYVSFREVGLQHIPI